MPNRNFSAGSYRYGFQRQEKDPELWEGAIFYKYRVEDPRLGRFFSTDPLEKKYPHNSPYAFSENRVIDGVELEGLELGWVMGTAWSSGGFDVNTSNQTGVAKKFMSDFKEVMKNPETYKSAVMGLGTIIAAGAITVPLEGMGSFILADNITMPAVSTSVENSIARYSVEQAAQDITILKTMTPWKQKSVNTVVVAGNESGFFVGVNKSYKGPISPNLGQPAASSEQWAVMNCAEPKAINKALLSGQAKSAVEVSNAYAIQSPQRAYYSIVKSKETVTEYSQGYIYLKRLALIVKPQ